MQVMNMDFAAGMRAAMKLTQQQKLTEATRVIQSALSGLRQPGSPANQASLVRAIDGPVIDLTAEVVEPEEVAEPEDVAVPGGGAGSGSELHQPSKIAAWAQDVGQLIKTRAHGELPRFSLDALARARSTKSLEVPEGAQFLSRSFTCAAGSRNYRLYIPRQLKESQRTLLVMLHGGTQDGEDFAAGTRMNPLAEEHGFIVAYPSQSKTANQSLCWNWFTPENQRRGEGEPAIIAGMTREIIAHYDVDPGRVFIAGLSAGGAMAAVMAATYPDLYAAIGVHSGLPYGSATDLPSAFAAMRGTAGPRRRKTRMPRAGADAIPGRRTIVFHGDADKIVHSSNAHGLFETCRPSEGLQHSEVRGSAGRRYTRIVSRDKAGVAVVEQWLIHGAGHAWSGGSPDGTYTDPRGPDASREMLRFFLEEGRD
jgi:poly(hydroxyalkanoate) depolymerase family esterase